MSERNSNENIRRIAIKRLLKGENPLQIYTSLQRTKPWFYKWLKRYRSGDPDWFRDYSRRPHTKEIVHLKNRGDCKNGWT